MSSGYRYEYRPCLDMDQIGEAPPESMEGFKPFLIIMESVAIVLVILVSSWTSYYRGGLAWSDYPSLEFNWHPLLMVIGLVVLYGNAMLIYRTQRNMRKRRLKLIHGGLMFVIIILTVVALVAVFDSHNLNKPDPIPNMYSLHSWIGLTTVILFCCQWVAGFLSFLYPGIQQNLRSSYMPIHVYFGIAGFVGAIATCLLGLNEKAFFSVSNYNQLPSEAVMINTIGLMLVLFGGTTVYLVVERGYRRIPKLEDDPLIPGTSQ